MRVAVFHNGFRTLGGAEVLAAEQAHGLAALGHEVRIVTFDFDSVVWGSRLHGLPVELVPRRSWGDILALFSRVSKWRARGLRAMKSMGEADVILAHNPPCHAILGQSRSAAVAAWYCHEPPRRLYPRETLPYLAAALDARPSDPALEPFRDLPEAWARLAASKGLSKDRQYEQAGVGGLDRIIANSSFCRDNAAKVYGRKDISVLPPIIPLPPTVLGRHGLSRDGLQILCLSRLERLKNVATVVKGFANYLQVDRAACLHIVGEGREKAALQELVSNLGIAASVRFHGFLQTAGLETLYANCHVFALLPLDEPFGMVFPEAASRGLLLVGPDHGGPLEVLEAGRYGWSVPALDSEALAEALKAVRGLSDGEADRRRNEACLACRGRYSPEILLPRLQELLRP